LHKHLIKMIRKINRPFTVRTHLRMRLALLLIPVLLAVSCQVQTSPPLITSRSTTASITETTSGSPTTSNTQGTDITTSGTTNPVTPSTTVDTTTLPSESAPSTTGTSATPSASTSKTIKPTKTPTPTKKATSPPTATPTTASTTVPTTAPTTETTPAGEDFPYKNYGTFFRDDYGENSSIVSSEDGGILIDIGCTAYGVALIQVDSIPAETGCKVIVSANGSSYQYDILYRGKFLGMPLQLGEGTYKVTVYEEIAANSFTTRYATSFDVNLASSLKPYTAASLMSDFSRGSGCTQKAASLCSGITTATGRVDAVYRWIVANIAYDRDLAGSITSGDVKTYVPNPEQTYSTRKGICFDYASLMCAMLRSQGIPTRLAVGTTSLGYHAWNEVYFAGTGWVIVASFSWQEISGSGWVMFDTTFAAGGMTPESIQEISRTKQKTY
jgi:hypothetical protein